MSVMKFFQAISRFLAAYTSPVIVGVAAVTFVQPELFRWVKGDVQTLVLGIIMLTMGMTLTTEDFKILAKRPFTLFPSLTLTVSIAFGKYSFENKSYGYPCLPLSHTAQS